MSKKWIYIKDTINVQIKYLNNKASKSLQQQKIGLNIIWFYKHIIIYATN